MSDTMISVLFVIVIGLFLCPWKKWLSTEAPTIKCRKKFYLAGDFTTVRNSGRPYIIKLCEELGFNPDGNFLLYKDGAYNHDEFTDFQGYVHYWMKYYGAMDSMELPCDKSNGNLSVVMSYYVLSINHQRIIVINDRDKFSYIIPDNFKLNRMSQHKHPVLRGLLIATGAVCALFTQPYLLLIGFICGALFYFMNHPIRK